MADIQRSYVLINRQLLAEFTDQVGGETGETETVKRQSPVMSPILDDEGNEIGQRRTGWTLYDAEAPAMAGGYALVGRSHDPEQMYSGIILVSPQAALLRQMVAALAEENPAYATSYIELYTAPSDEEDFDAEFESTDSLDAATQYRIMAYAAQGVEVEAADTAVGQLNDVLVMLNQAHPGLDMEPIEGDTNRDTIEGIFSQVKPNWKIGKDNIG